MSADQYRAIVECLSAKPNWQSAVLLRGHGRKCQVLSAEELEALADAPFWTHQRVSAPYLTATEQAALRQCAKEAMAFAREAFSEENS
jgi:hypothetical protein